MRSTITLNGKNSSEIEGLLIQSLPPISKPLMRTQIDEIDGRDGDIVTNLGFSAYTKEFTIGLYGDFDINEIISYFNSEGTVTFSNEPDMYYNYQIISQIDFERLIRYRTATVAMHCQPFKYSTTEGADILSSSDNFATLNQSLNTDSTFYTYTSNVQADVTATRTTAGTGGKFFAVFTIPVVQGITYHFSGNVASNVTMYAYTDTLRGTNAGIAGKPLKGDYAYTATFTGTMVLGFYSSVTNPVFIRNFFVTNEEAGVISGEGNDIVLEGTSEAPFLTLTAKGDTYQQTLSGKNLYDATLSETSKNSVTYSADNEKIYVNGKATTDFGCNFKNISLTAGTYTLTVELVAGSVTSTSAANGALFLFNGQNITRNPNQTYVSTSNPKGTFVVTVSADTTDAHIHIWARGTETFTNAVFKYQLVSGSTADYNFEPYCGAIPSPNPDYPQDIQVVTGEQTVNVHRKNLFPVVNQDFTVGSINFKASNGSLYLNGTSSGETSTNNQNFKNNFSFTLSAGSYVLSLSEKITAMSLRKMSDGTILATINGDTIKSATFTLNEETEVYLGVYLYQISFSNKLAPIQLEQGSTATAYEPYQGQSYTISLGSTELCKIGNYQDYIYKSGDDWYVKKEIGVATLDGSENWDIANTGQSSWFYIANIYDKIHAAQPPYPLPVHEWAYSTHYINKYIPQGDNEGFAVFTGGNVVNIRIKEQTEDTIANFKTWLATNLPKFYIPLATPTDTQITDATLIGELEAFNNAHAYKGLTYIKTNSTGTNLPHIIEAEVAGNMDGTVTNSGNTTARPKLTIFGSGNIGVYLNGIQIFQIAMGSEGHITIDTEAMEAYQDTTDNLKNRLVTGDYSNFVLQAGDNQISFSGNATMCVVENYSRWL